MRRPKPEAIAGEPLGGRAAVWVAIRDVHRRFNDGFTALEIAYRARVPAGTAQYYMRCLVRAGFLAMTPGAPVGGRYAAATFRLVRDAGLEAPRVRRDGTIDREPTGQERMWSAMKAMRSFSLAELMAATGIAEHTAKTYLRRLAAAGYLAAVEPGRPWHPGLWRLVRNTGPRAPCIRNRAKTPPGADPAQRVLDLNDRDIQHSMSAPRSVARSQPPPMSAEPQSARPEPAAEAKPGASGNVVDLVGYRQARAGQAEPPPAEDRERALARRRRWIGRALRVSEVARTVDRPGIWRRAAQIIHRFYVYLLHEDFIV
jgi:hypothetical protein